MHALAIAVAHGSMKPQSAGTDWTSHPMHTAMPYLRHLSSVALLAFATSTDVVGSQHPFGSENVVVNGGAHWVDAGELKGGGADEILVAMGSGHYQWYKFAGGSSFQGPFSIATTSSATPQCVHAADINNDSLADVLLASGNPWNSSSNSLLGWCENSTSSPGTFGSIHIIDDETNLTSLMWAHACDLNGDGLNDALAFSLEGTSWYENLGGPTFNFGPQQVIDSTPADSNGWRPHVKDIDGDSDLDIVICAVPSGVNEQVAWLENDGSTTPSFTLNALTFSQLNTYANVVHSADLDGDGTQDLVTGTSGELRWALNSATGFNTQQDNYHLGYCEPWGYVTADFDVDGDIDVVVGRRMDLKAACDIKYVNNQGGATMGPLGYVFCHPDAAWNSQATTWPTRNLVAADLNYNGCLDLLTNSSGHVLWFRNEDCQPIPFPDNCGEPLQAVWNGSYPFINDHGITTGSEGQTEICNPGGGGGTGISNDIWASWMAPTTGVVTVSTCGMTNFDTKIAVYQGQGCPEDGSSIACDDNSCSEESQVQFDAVADQHYMIQLGNAPGTSPGAGAFTITSEGAFSSHPFDECQTTNWELSNGLAHLDTRGASHTSSPATTGEDLTSCGIYNDVFAYYTAETSGLVTISTCRQGSEDTADFDTKFAVFEGACVSANLLACNDDSCGSGSTVSFQGSVGVTYTVQMGGAGPYEMGAATLYISQETGTPFCTGGPTNCPCSNACDDTSLAAGCSNSAGTCGSLSALGSSSVTSDSLQLIAQGVVPGLPLLFFQGENPINDYTGIPFGDGLRCVGLNVRRLQVTYANELGFANSSVDIVTGGSVSAGDTLYYQCWYRQGSSGGPCGNSHNLTNGLGLDWGA